MPAISTKRVTAGKKQARWVLIETCRGDRKNNKTAHKEQPVEGSGSAGMNDTGRFGIGKRQGGEGARKWAQHEAKEHGRKKQEYWT